MDYQGTILKEFFQTNGRQVLERVNNNHTLRYFTENEIRLITNNYSTMLGNGAFGEVYKGMMHDGSPVAVKRYIDRNGSQKEVFAKEVIVHSQINHKNVVRLLGCCTEENALMIVMEFISNGNLSSILHCNSSDDHVPLPLDKRLNIAIGVAEALWCMHSMYSPVLHGDIKPANILLDENLVPKISDFGIARLLCAIGAQRTINITGSLGYMDPAFYENGILTPRSDVYSFGVVLLEIITRKKPACVNITLDQSFSEVLAKGKKVLHMFDKEISGRENLEFLQGIVRLAAKCLQRDVKMRPEMVEVATSLRMIRKAMHGQEENPYPEHHPASKRTRNFVCSPINSTISHSIFTYGNDAYRSFFRGFLRKPQKNDLLMGSQKTCLTWQDALAIPADKILEVTKNFGHEALIGEGSFGRVYFGCLRNGRSAAVKKMDFHNQPDEEFLSQVSMVSRLKHENVVELLGYCANGTLRVLAYEFGTMGSLHDMLHGRKGVKEAQPGPVLSWAQRVKIAVGVAKGLEYLHEKAEPQIIHRKINPNNVLLFDDDVAKIADFDLSNEVPITGAPVRWARCLRHYGTLLGYDAPEYAMAGQLSYKSDVFSFGVVLLELLTGRKAVDGTLPMEQRSLLAWVTPRLGEDKVRQCVDSKLGGDYPFKDVAKFAAVAEVCVQYEAEFRPDMSIVVRALQPLLNYGTSIHPSSGYSDNTKA
ncbi:hypothetical protein U9M48_041821 [Paspalum notatum var. saurae]|uniref:Protein kinase domain-containing protein n=1 Tax=Paspalum notatum var. saurae TaxID=547442 RepID=A0AAQ3UPM3_PASNO